MLLTFIYPHDDIFEAVKQESSQFSIRQTDNNGNPLFEALVFDEAYLPKFRELFLNAQAEISPALITYQSDIPMPPNYLERRDFSKNRDFLCHLNMPDGFDAHYASTVEDGIFNFLKDWIMYKWLETKRPDVASLFYNNCKGDDGYYEKVRRALNKRTTPIRRWHGYW